MYGFWKLENLPLVHLTVITSKNSIITTHIFRGRYYIKKFQLKEKTIVPGYHHSTKTGKTEVCHAGTKTCIYADPSDPNNGHHNSLEEAEAYSEKRLEQENSGSTDGLDSSYNGITPEHSSNQFLKDVQSELNRETIDNANGSSRATIDGFSKEHMDEDYQIDMDKNGEGFEIATRGKPSMSVLEAKFGYSSVTLSGSAMTEEETIDRDDDESDQEWYDRVGERAVELTKDYEEYIKD